jgi:hypothetical protein
VVLTGEHGARSSKCQLIFRDFVVFVLVHIAVLPLACYFNFLFALNLLLCW